MRRVGGGAIPRLTSGALGAGQRRRGGGGSGAAPGRGAGSPGAVGADGGQRDPRISYRARGGRSFLFLLSLSLGTKGECSASSLNGIFLPNVLETYLYMCLF